MVTPLEVLSPIRLCGASNDDDCDVDRQTDRVRYLGLCARHYGSMSLPQIDELLMLHSDKKFPSEPYCWARTNQAV